MENNIYDVLKKLDIKYERIKHKPVYTVQEIKDIKLNIDGTGCKNIFLKDKKHNFYLYVLQEDKRVDFKYLQKELGNNRLSFANPEELYQYLKLEQGAVTPLGIINNEEKNVTVLLDKELKGKVLLVHPNINTETISIKYDDLTKFIENHGNIYMEI